LALKTHSIPGRTIRLDGREHLYFSGAAYLGMAQHPVFQEYLREGLAAYGAHFGGSRKSNIQLAIFEEVEEYLARCTGMESALVFSSGTLAGQVLLKALSGEAILSAAPGVHPALWGEGAVPGNGDWGSWAEQAAEACQQSGPPLALLSNALDPLSVREYDFSFLRDIQPRRRVLLIVDDSHGFGLRGIEGAGIFPSLSTLTHVECLGISSLGKACGIPAGAVFGPRHWIQRIWDGPFFGGASPAPAPYLHAFLRAGDLYALQRQTLREQVQHFLHHLPQAVHLRHIPDFPVFFSADEALSPRLEAKGIVLSSFRYPSAEDPVFTRIVINSLHTRADLEKLLEALAAESICTL
jgi:7-keto-8-aminopelargonate synthetase-like enzyme